MKRNTWTRRILAAVLLLALAAGMALAESWPEESVTDANGDTWKKVPREDGGFQIWQFIGIFGDKEAALQAVGLREEDAEKEPVSGTAEDAGKKKVKIGKRKYRYKLEKKASSWKLKLKSGQEKKGGDYTDTGKKKVLKKKKKKMEKLYWLGGIGNNTVKFNNIYLQENRESGV